MDELHSLSDRELADIGLNRFLAGGAVAGGQVRTTWPGLAEDRLFQGRDLAPTTDLRAVAKGLLRDHLRLPAGALAQAFPGSEGVAPMGGLVRAA